VTGPVDLKKLKLSLTGIDRQDPGPDGRYDHQRRVTGFDNPATALTMVGLNRLNSLQVQVEAALVAGVPGDLIETGVWRGGCCILMRAILAVAGITDRVVWVADSFQGMPPGEPENWNEPILSVPLEQVRENFRFYGYLDEQVRFLPGWFRDTLPGPVRSLAVLRLDGDYYVSTRDALVALYPKLSPGGYVIIDDWCFEYCQRAVLEYRQAHGITEPIQVPEDNRAAWWQKVREV
jgi:Macrocin-O-methyltransferase (TylF)